jgi:hypothetical protein
VSVDHTSPRHVEDSERGGLETDVLASVNESLGGKQGRGRCWLRGRWGSCVAEQRRSLVKTKRSKSQ